MLCERLTNVERLADRGYVAEPKLDGQRAPRHVHDGRAVACFSRRGLDLLGPSQPGRLPSNLADDERAGTEAG